MLLQKQALLQLMVLLELLRRFARSQENEISTLRDLAQNQARMRLLARVFENSGEAIFGDEGARIKSTTKGSKKNILWNPITLALGINDVYRVPMSRLKRVFEEHDFLMEWHHEWIQTLDLLGE